MQGRGSCVRYRILGPLEVSRVGHPVSLGGPQQQALLALLLLHANRVVSTDRLIEHLWGDRAPSTARGLLHGCVANLRRALQGDDGARQPLARRASGYLLEVASGELDRDRFEELARASTALVGDHSVRALKERSALLTEALALWHGPVLDGVAVDACRPEIMRLEESRLVVLEERLEVDLRLGRHTGIVAELQSQVRTHPLREHLWALLMTALARAGRQSDALTAYRHLRDTLVDQLGVEPSATVQELHRQILSGSLDEDDHDLPPGPSNRVVRFTAVDGRRIAWSAVGSGPPVVMCSWWFGNLELDRRCVSFQRFVGMLAERHTVIWYDRRRTGLSDRDDPPHTHLQEEVAVLAAVVDAVGKIRGLGEGVSLFGGSCGGCVVAAYAATHPDRVDRVVLYGSYTYGAEIAPRETRESIIALVAADWGLGSRLLTDIFLPSGALDERDEFARFQRASATAAGAASWLRAAYEFDVRDLLGDVHAPTLVIHRRADRAVPFALGQDLASRIPNASFVALDGADHLPWRGDAQALARTTVSFLC